MTDLWEVWLSSELVIGDEVVVASGEPADDPGEAPGSLHLVTGWNPGGVATDAPTNALANVRLVEELDRLGIVHEPATGRAPDGSWHEDGVALHGVRRAVARDIGRRYGQLAIYEWQPSAGVVLVVSCDDDRVAGRVTRR